MRDYSSELNKEQHKIVTSADGHCLVLAGAGSGKTRTLTYRVAYLLENGVKPENILLMTFTNKAANEMVTRVQDLLGYNPYALSAGTFHRVGNMILRKYGHLLGFDSNFAILDQQDSKALVKLIFKEQNIDVKSGNFPKADVVRSMISYASNTAQKMDDWLCVKYNFPSFVLDQIIAVNDQYQKRKLELNAMDFDDLLVKWRFLLRDFPQIKSELAQKFQYILVDEYQDTNNIQARIIQDLASIHKNVLAVGDDSQSIYSFRAADISHILNFEKNFDDTTIYKLQTNYRSTPEILELANQSIAYNTKQYFKELQSVKDSGTKPLVIAARNVYQQSDYIIDRIKEVQEAGGTLADIAVLFRAGHMSAELQLALSKHNIPFIVRSGQKYFDQAHIKDLTAILRIWLNHHDELSWKRFLNLLPGIGPKTADKLFAQVKELPTLSEIVQAQIKLSPKQKESWHIVNNILAYLDDISKSDKTDIADGIRYIFQSFYKAHLKNTYDDFESRSDDIAAFMNFASNYTDLEKLLTDITLDESASNQSPDSAEEQKLVLSTIHQAKGLEWDEVMVIGAREGAFPHFRSKESLNELEEERRLFYVAVTRARHKLSILYPVRVKSYEYGEIMSDPSMFIQELDEDCYTKFPKNDFAHRSYLGDYGFSDDEKLSHKKGARWQPGQDFFGDDVDNAHDDSQDYVDPDYEDEVIIYE